MSDLSGFSMTNLFLMEAEEQSQTLSDGLLKLDKNPNDMSDIPALMRAAHSLKGGARIVQSDRIVEFAHAMEDFFVAVSKNELTINSTHIDRLLAGVDIIAEMSTCGEDGFKAFTESHEKQFVDMTAEFRNFISNPEVTETAKPKPEKKSKPKPEKETATEEIVIQPDPDSANFEGEIFPDSSAEKIETESEPIPEKETATEDNFTSSESIGVVRKFSSSKDGLVKVAAPRMEKILGLAGETFIHTKKVRSVEETFHLIRSDFSLFSDMLEKLIGYIPEHHMTEDLLYSCSMIKEDYDKLFRRLSAFASNISDFGLEMEGFSEKLYDEVVSCKIMPFEDLSKVFSRMVRDVSRKLGKKVNLKIIGEKTGLDRDILEKLEAPLVHLLRNAIDHGLETPDSRKKAGKSEAGTIVISAHHWAGMFNITMTDDGRGIDIENLRKIIVNRGLVNSNMAKDMPDSEVLDFLFLPGFSTKTTVSELSGRGVGLDVVMNMIQEVKGEISIDTKLGEYTAFKMRLPVSLSVVSSLIVDIGDEFYAFPANRIDHLLYVPIDELKTLENHQFVEYNGENIGVVAGRDIFGYPPKGAENNMIPLLIVSDRYNCYAMAVDHFIGEEKIAVRPLDKRLGKLTCINSVAVLDDGSTVLTVDIDDVVRSIDNRIKHNMLHNFTRSETSGSAESSLRILVVDDSITVRELEKHILESHNYSVDTAVNGVDGWNAVRTVSYDLIITDIDMPRMNGFELVTKIKSDVRLADIPVIIVSYKDRQEDRLKGMECGANYYLTKSSFHDNTLIDAVQKLTGKAATP